MDIGGYLVIVRRWWWTLLVATCVSALIAYLVASRIQPTYEAQAQLLVGPINTDVDTLRASSQLAQTYAQLAISQPLLESTAKEFGGSVDPTQLAENVRATASDVTRILVIRVDDASPKRAADLTNTLANELIQLTSGATSRPEGQLQLVGAAQVPTSPVAPQVSLIVLLAAMAGLLGALVLVILVEALSDAVRDVKEVSELVGAPVLGIIDAPSVVRPGPALVEAAPGSPPAIALRQLAAKVLDAQPGPRPHPIALVGLEESEAAVVASNLAAAATLNGYRSVVIDGAVGGTLSRLLGVEQVRGVRELVRGESTRIEGVTSGGSGTTIIPSGGGRFDGLGRERARGLIERIGAGQDVVVVDAGGVSTSPVALDWIAAVPAVVLVVALGRHPSRTDVRLAGESIRLAGGALAGIAILRGGARIGGRGRRANQTVTPTPAYQAAAGAGQRYASGAGSAPTADAASVASPGVLNVTGSASGGTAPQARRLGE